MATLCQAEGVSIIEETMFENRMIHVKELGKMGAQITLEQNKAIIRGVDALYGCEVIASDVRASCSLVLAGLSAQGQTKMTGIGHWQRGYDKLEEKLSMLGGFVQLIESESNELENLKLIQTLPS
jgi:UDP-N-acetylglucosamine 1-carboxyvinyltransferase